MNEMPSTPDSVLVGTRIPPHSLSQVILGKPRGRVTDDAKPTAIENATMTPALGRALYFVAAVLAVTPAVDLLTNVWPLAFGDLRWRYGAVGLLSGFLLTSLLGMVLAVITAAALRHRRLLSLLFIANIAAALVLLAAVGLFGLDVLQVRVTVPMESRGLFDVGAAKALFKHGTLMISFAALGLGARSCVSQRSAGRA